jgi:hypothetical protein
MYTKLSNAKFNSSKKITEKVEVRGSGGWGEGLGKEE